MDTIADIFIITGALIICLLVFGRKKNRWDGGGFIKGKKRNRFWM